VKLLLISNSGRPHFAHCAGAIREFVGPGATVGFVTAASLGDEGDYISLIRSRLVEGDMAQSVAHVDWRGGWRRALDSVDAVFVGGGNTYALMERLATSGLGEAIGERVRTGLPYLGSSAGANVAGPNILTTNDWNVVGSRTFDALALVAWNINPHYVAGAAEAPTGETRDDRIREYLDVRENPIVAIEEGAHIELVNGVARVRGTGRARVFERDEPDRWLEPGDMLDARFSRGEVKVGGAAVAALRPAPS